MVPLETSGFSTRYKRIRLLGEGGQGVVWLVKKTDDNTYRVAKSLKNVSRGKMTWCGIRKRMIPDEILLSESLDHPNISKLKEIYLEQDRWIIIMEYFPNFIDLFDYINLTGPMGTSDAKIIISKVMDVLNYLVSIKIDHWDIKDENILYNHRTKEIKLIDFGSASYFTENSYTKLQGTEMYTPPEFHRNGKYRALPGISWAVGCLTYILLNGKCPFESKQDIIEYKTLTFKDEMDKLTRHFLQSLMEENETKRMLPANIPYHPWVKNQN